MLGALVVKGIPGCHILTMPMQSFLLLPLVPLTRYVLPLILQNYAHRSSQYLDEDPRTNRIDDSLQLFTQICSNALLKNVHLVLFLSASSWIQLVPR